MGYRVSFATGSVLLLVWAWLILIRHLPAGWPHVLYATGAILVIRGIALRDADA